VTTNLKHVPISRSKERNARFTSSFYAHVSRNAASVASDTTRSFLRRTYVVCKRFAVSGRSRVASYYVVTFSTELDALQRRLRDHKRTGNSNG
jgi:hypothetical protein